MIIDILTAVCITILAIKVIILESKLRKSEWRNEVQHRRYERDIMYLSRTSKWNLNSAYGKLAWMDTGFINNEKED